uniref:Uncharacterized protein n=1 Tax=Anguilla anguilla TaxID=7936 RepID=A0A0E9PVF4_ANGAN
MTCSKKSLADSATYYIQGENGSVKKKDLQQAPPASKASASLEY